MFPMLMPKPCSGDFKWMQEISNYTRTDLALGCLGIHPFENIVDKRYLVIHPQYKVCMFWLFMKQYPYMKCQCFSATKFLCAMFTKRYYIIGKKCKIATDELCIHLFHHCPTTEMHRRTFWSNVITLVGREKFVSLYETHQTVQILDALGGFSSFVLPDQTRTKVACTVLKFVHKLYS